MNDQDIYGGVFGSGVGLSLAPRSNVNGATFSGDGVTTTFTFPSETPIISDNVNSYDVIIHGVGQVPTDAFTVSVAANTITFVEAPPAGSRNIYVRIITQAVSETSAAAVTISGYLTAIPEATPVPNFAGIGGPFNSQAQALLNNIAAMGGGVTLNSYNALRNYDGPAAIVDIVGQVSNSAYRPITGKFVQVAAGQSDNGGTVIVDSLGRVWERVTDSDVYLDWFLPDNYNPDSTSCHVAATAAWLYCVAKKKRLIHGLRRYRTIEESFPYGRVDGSTPAALINWGGVAVLGSGPGTILESASISGADVIQLNAPDNLEIGNFTVRSYITGSSSGSNGVSVTGGWDRLKIHDIYSENLAYVEKPAYLDGGKALSIQAPIAGSTLKCGSLEAWNIGAKYCVYAVGIEMDLVTAATMPISINIRGTAENCREAVLISAAGATSAIPDDWRPSINIDMVAINCMQDVVLSRAHGANINCVVVTTQTDDARIRNSAGAVWKAGDTINSVIGLNCAYAHDSKVTISGNKGSCSYKALVGGASAGSSGLVGATQGSKFICDLTGTASVEDFGAVDSGGNVTTNCLIAVGVDMAAPNIAHYLPSRNNAIVVGNVSLVKDLLVQGAIKFTYTDGNTVYGEIGYDDEGVVIKQTLGSSNSLRPFKVANHAAVPVLAVRNDGCPAMPINTATAVGPVTGVVAVYDIATNTLAGYAALHSTFTP